MTYKQLFDKAAEVYAEVADKVSLSERLWDEAVSEFWAYVAEVFGAAGFTFSLRSPSEEEWYADYAYVVYATKVLRNGESYTLPLYIYGSSKGFSLEEIYKEVHEEWMRKENFKNVEELLAVRDLKNVIEAKLLEDGED